MEAESQDKPKRTRKAVAKGNNKPKAKKSPQKVTQAPRKRAGRPEKWDELEMIHKLDAVKGWAMQGATMDELAGMVGVATSVLYEWKKKYPEFSEALRAGRDVARGELIASAFRQSTGYKVKDSKPIKVKRWEFMRDPVTNEFLRDPRTGEYIKVCNEYIEIVEVDVSVAANAQITQFMLKNWLPDHFKDKQEIETYGKQAPTFVDDITGEG